MPDKKFVVFVWFVVKKILIFLQRDSNLPL